MQLPFFAGAVIRSELLKQAARQPPESSPVQPATAVTTAGRRSLRIPYRHKKQWLAGPGPVAAGVVRALPGAGTAALTPQ